MAKGKFQGTTATDDWSPKQLQALRLPFPEGLDPLFRLETDAEDDFTAAYERAIIFTVVLGETRVAYLWQQALKIGFRAGRGSATESVRTREASEDYALGHEAGLNAGRTGGLRDGKQDGRKAGKAQGLKEGEAIGFEKGKIEGLAEGKRQGFVAGREFGEKQATKLSKAPAPERVFVDTGTDPLVADLAPPPPPSSVPLHTSTQTDTPPVTVIPSIVPDPPLSWADESYCIHAPNPNPIPPLTLRDFSALRSDTTSSTPFSTLQYRAGRKQRFTRPPRCPTSRFSSLRPFTTSTAPVYCPAATLFASKPFRVASTLTLDWDHDPRLYKLSRVLRSMGWARGGGGSV